MLDRDHFPPFAAQQWLCALVLCAGLSEAPAIGQIACRYEIVAMIQAPPGPNVNSPTVPLSISPNGQYIVGYFNYDGVGMDRAWVYTMSDGPFFTLPLPPGGYVTSLATAVNDVGQIVGVVSGTAGDRGFIYSMSNGLYVLIPPLNANGSCEVTDINANGVACGVRAMGPPGLTTAFIWDPILGVTDLGHIDGQGTGFGALSDTEIAVGYRGSYFGAPNARGIAGYPPVVGVLPPIPDGTTSSLRDVNNGGDACGRGSLSNGLGNRAFVFRKESITVLGETPSMLRSTASVVSEAALVGGYFRGPYGTNPDMERASLWELGPIVDVNLLIEDQANVLLRHVLGISTDGTLVCSGGSVYIDNPHVIVLFPNSNVADQDRGAAILITGGSTSSPGDESQPVILRVRFTGNFATLGGAVYIRSNQNSNPQFRNCTFDNNEAVTSGGAIEVDDLGNQASACGPIIINCLFHDNEGGGNGSAVHTDDFCTTVFRHCTITQNHSDGAAIAHDVAASTEPQFRTGQNSIFSSIVYGNTNDGSPSTSLGAQVSGAAQMETCCIQNFGSPYPSGDGNISSDPLFADPSSNDFRPECGSPVIGAADDDDVQADAFDLNQDNSLIDDNPDILGWWRITGINNDGSDSDMGGA